jgi:hypothetical protein
MRRFNRSMSLSRQTIGEMNFQATVSINDIFNRNGTRSRARMCASVGKRNDEDEIEKQKENEEKRRKKMLIV